MSINTNIQLTQLRSGLWVLAQAAINSIVLINRNNPEITQSSIDLKPSEVVIFRENQSYISLAFRVDSIEARIFRWGSNGLIFVTNESNLYPQQLDGYEAIHYNSEMIDVVESTIGSNNIFYGRVINDNCTIPVGFSVENPKVIPPEITCIPVMPFEGKTFQLVNAIRGKSISRFAPLYNNDTSSGIRATQIGIDVNGNKHIIKGHVCNAEVAERIHPSLRLMEGQEIEFKPEETQIGLEYQNISHFESTYNIESFELYENGLIRIYTGYQQTYSNYQRFSSGDIIRIHCSSAVPLPERIVLFHRTVKNIHLIIREADMSTLVRESRDAALAFANTGSIQKYSLIVRHTNKESSYYSNYFLISDLAGLPSKHSLAGKDSIQNRRALSNRFKVVYPGKTIPGHLTEELMSAAENLHLQISSGELVPAFEANWYLQLNKSYGYGLGYHLVKEIAMKDIFFKDLYVKSQMTDEEILAHDRVRPAVMSFLITAKDSDEGLKFLEIPLVKKALFPCS